MKSKMSVIFLLWLILVSCDFNKSVSKDFISDIFTKGDGLSCDDVYLSDGTDRINRNSFIYGEKFYLNFNNMEGFRKEEGFVFPGLQLLVLGTNGDTIMLENDLYANNSNGFDISPLLLQTNLTVADPMHSNGNYKLLVQIWDKKGEGTFLANMDFEVTPNTQIKIENNNISYREIYLFSQERNICITDNEAKFNENIYLIFEGLEGFKTEAGIVSIGLSLKCKDSEGTLILDEDDLIGDAEMEASELRERLAPNFIFSGSDIKNPVTCEVIIWDKKSNHSIKASVDLNIK